MVQIEALINDLQRPEGTFEIPVCDRVGKRIGSLRPFNTSLIENAELVQLLCDWRNRNRDFFITPDPTTPEKTRIWLERQVFGGHDRAMFWIEIDNVQYGHIGFRSLTEESAEPDNLIRGREGGPSNLIERSKIAMLGWMFDTLGIRHTHVRVLRRAAIARMLYQRIGYAIKDDSDSRLIALELTRENYYRLYAPDGGNTS